VPARLRILIASTPVGPLGSGIGGGVELTLHGIATGLQRRGHEVTIIAPAGSLDGDVPVVQVRGELQLSSQLEARDAPVALPPGSVLANMWNEVRARQDGADVVLNLAYDWLPLYLTPFLRVPVDHLVSMGSVSEAMDGAVSEAIAARPGTIAMHSRAQAATFPGRPDVLVIGSGLDLRRYTYVDRPERRLAWVARISAEKGLEDAVEVAARTGWPLSVWGLMQDEWAWKDAIEAYPDAQVMYEGFVPTEQLQAGLGRCAALLVTPRWVEAFGNVAIEALACGVPVIAYDRGGPAEIVVDGRTGFVVPAGDVDALVAAVGRVDEIDRAACRRHAEDHYSVAALAERVEAWLLEVAGRPPT
jgi:UDP-glucose:tetrahydrobiopterin glucosyltransferase